MKKLLNDITHVLNHVKLVTTTNRHKSKSLCLRFPSRKLP